MWLTMSTGFQLVAGRTQVCHVFSFISLHFYSLATIVLSVSAVTTTSDGSSGKSVAPEHINPIERGETWGAAHPRLRPIALA